MTNQSSMSSRSVAACLTIGFFSSVISSVIVEVVYRQYQFKKYERMVQGFSHPVLRLDKATIIRLKPDVRRLNKTPQGDPKKPPIEWSFSTDHYGMRISSPPSSSKQAIRIFAIGDSYTLGWAVNDNETYPHFLTAALRHRFPGISIEVINGGVYAFNSWQEAQFLEAVGDQIRPHLVILGYVVNDAEAAGFDIYLHPETRYQGWFSWMLHDLKEAVVQFSYRRWQQSSGYQAAIFYNKEFLEGSRGWKESRRALNRMKEYCRKHKIPFVVAIFPDVTRDLGAAYPYASIHSAVAIWGTEDGYPVFDLLPDFRNFDHQDLWVEGEGHPNARAYRIFAVRLAEALMDYLQPLTRFRSNANIINPDAAVEVSGGVIEGR